MSLTFKESLINARPGAATLNSYVCKQNVACNVDIKIKKNMFKRHVKFMI